MEEPATPMLWSNLQRLLLEAMPDGVEIRTNAQFVAYDYEAVPHAVGDAPRDAVRAHFISDRIRANPFANWGNDPAAAAAAAPATAAAEGNGTPEPQSAPPQRESVLARTVVGADGINSRVRAEMYRIIGGADWERMASAEYSGFISYKGRGSPPDKAAAVAAAVGDAFVGDSGVCMVKCRRARSAMYDAPSVMLARLSREAALHLGFDWVFATHLSVPEALARCKPEVGGHAALCENALSQLRNAHFPADIVEFASEMLSVDAAAKAAADNKKLTVIARPLFVVPVDYPHPYQRVSAASVPPQAPPDFFRAFGEGRVFLAGDSLHGMPPFYAQGTGMGSEDVVELVEVLANAYRWDTKENVDPTRDELCAARVQYRKARLARLVRVQRETLNIRSRHDAQGLADFLNWVCCFRPVATGWHTT